MRISDWSSDVCSSDLTRVAPHPHARRSFASSSPRHTVNLVNSAPVMPESPLLPVAEAQARLFAMAAPVAVEHAPLQIGRASCRERVCQYVSISVVAVPLKKKNKGEHTTQKSLI